MRRLVIALATVACAFPALAFGFTATATNAANRAAAASVFRPVSVTPPAVTGTPRSGATLTASPGDWNRRPEEFTYAWERCDGTACHAVGGGRSYVATDGDVGSTLRVLVTARNAGGSTTRASSRTARIQERVRAPVSTATPAIEGPPEEGATLTATSGAWTGAATHTVRWERCRDTCTGIDGATEWSYRLAAADAGRHVRAMVTATNEGGSTSAASDPTSEVKGEAAMYAEAVLRDQPALFWSLDGPTPDDASGHARHGRRLSGTPEDSGAMTGSGSHLQPRLQLHGAPVTDARTATVEAWVKPATSPHPDAIAVIGDNSGGYGLHAGGPTLAGGGTCLWLVNFHVPSYGAEGCSLDPGVWTHVAVVVDGEVSRLYVDGVLAAGPRSIPTIPPRPRFTVGFAYAEDGTTPQNPWSGAIDDVAVYAAALPAERIREHFARGTQGG